MPNAPSGARATFLGLQSNDVGYLLPAGNTLWVSAGQTLSHAIGTGATQFDWLTFEVKAASSRSDEGITAFAVRGQHIAVATAHTEQTESGAFGVGDGVYLSSDGGTNWTHYPITELFLDRAGMGIPGGDTQCFGIWFDGPNLWAAFTTEFAIMSPDFGATWQRYRPDSLNNPQPNPFPGDPDRMQRYRHLNYRAFDGIAANGALWVSTNAGINRSIDGGVTWVNYDAGSAGLTGDFVPVLAADTANGIIWAGTQTTGIDEQELKDNPRDYFPDGQFTSLDWDLDRDGRIDRPGKNGVSWTTDGGATWHGYVPTEDPALARDFAAWGFAFNGQTVWVAGSSGGADALLRSDNLGQTWRLQPIITTTGDTVSTELGTTDVAYLEGVLWITSSRGLARSENDGATWEFVLRYPQTRPLGGGDVVNPQGAASGLTTYAFPSPSAPRLGSPPQIVFALTAATDVTIEIFDASGGLVRTLRQQGVQPGNRTVEWNGRTDDGRPVANGVYLYKITTGDGHTALGKMMVLN